MNIRFVAGVALGIALLGSGAASGEEPRCKKWGMDVSCSTSVPRLAIGDQFTASVLVRNTGEVVLNNVTIRLRGDQGAPCVSGPGSGVTLLVEKLEPGESKELSANFGSETIGVARIIGNARDSLGWASGACSCTVEIYGLTAIQSEMSDKALDGTERGVFRVGEEYVYALVVRNDVGTGETPEIQIALALPPELEFVSGKTDREIGVSGKDQAAKTAAFVLKAPNQNLAVEFRVRVIAVPASRLVKARATVETTTGVELASDSESTTIQQK